METKTKKPAAKAKKPEPKPEPAQPVVAEVKAPEPVAEVKPEPTKPAIKYELVETGNRAILAEGRSSGVGFVFAKPDGNKLTTVNALTCCKDYMNEQVYSEATGRPYARYGYQATKQSIFDTGYGYVILGILGSRYNSDSPDVNAIKWMNEHLADIQKFINTFEDMLKVERTELSLIADNRHAAKLAKFWITQTYRMSLWALLVRFATDSKWTDKIEFWDALAKCKTQDCSMITPIIPKMKKMVEGKLPDHDMVANETPPSACGSWHNAGIVSWPFPS